MYTVPILYYYYYYYYDSKQLHLRTSEKNGSATATTTSHHNRWRQEQHDRRRRLWPRTASGDSACVRTPTSGVCVFLSVQLGRLKVSRSLFCGHTRTRTRRGSRVLDECAGSRASVCTHRRVVAVFQKEKSEKNPFARSRISRSSNYFAPNRFLPVFFHNIIFISTTICTINVILQRAYCSIRNIISTCQVKQFYIIGVSYATRAGSDFSTIRLFLDRRRRAV